MQVPIQVNAIWFLLHNMTTLININTWIPGLLYKERFGATHHVFVGTITNLSAFGMIHVKKNSTDPDKEEKDDDYYYHIILLLLSSLSLFLLSLYIFITIIIIIIVIWSHLHHCGTVISVGHPMEIYPIGCFLYGLYVS